MDNNECNSTRNDIKIKQEENECYSDHWKGDVSCSKLQVKREMEDTSVKIEAFDFENCYLENQDVMTRISDHSMDQSNQGHPFQDEASQNTTRAKMEVNGRIHPWFGFHVKLKVPSGYDLCLLKGKLSQVIINVQQFNKRLCRANYVHRSHVSMYKTFVIDPVTQQFMADTSIIYGRLTVGGILNLLRDTEDSVDVVLEPPLEEPEGDSDRDSDASDDEVTGNFDHLPRRILLANVLPNETEDGETTEEPQRRGMRELRRRKRRKVDGYNWHNNPAEVTNVVSDFDNETPILNGVTTAGNPAECLDLYWSSEWIENLCRQSKIYAHQKSLSSDEVTPANMKMFLAVLLLSGYNGLPGRRQYWSESPDLVNQLVSNSMRRDSFEQILRCLHFADTTPRKTQDRFHKVRPLFEHINRVSRCVNGGEFVNIDKIMVPYYGKHEAKQFVRGKPVRFGYKLWAACTSDGFLLHVIPYCGAHSEREMGHGPAVVLEMCEQLKLGNGQHLMFDDFFGTIPLLKELSYKNIAATCTLREDRLSEAPLLGKKEIEKKDRGYMEEVFINEVSLVKWKEDKAVTVASNKLRSFPLQKAKRYSKITKKHIQIDMPNSIHFYGKYTGGVGTFDQHVAAYGIRIRSKKWWWSLFAWSINAQAVNAWRIYQKLGNDLTLLQFIRQAVIATLKSHGRQRKIPGPKHFSAGVSTDSVRFNGLPHWVMRGEQPYSRCRNCGRRTVYMCEMCDVPLHPECMKTYHVKEK